MRGTFAGAGGPTSGGMPMCGQMNMQMLQQQLGMAAQGMPPEMRGMMPPTPLPMPTQQRPGMVPAGMGPGGMGPAGMGPAGMGPAGMGPGGMGPAGMVPMGGMPMGGMWPMGAMSGVGVGNGGVGAMGGCACRSVPGGAPCSTQGGISPEQLQILMQDEGKLQQFLAENPSMSKEVMRML